MSGAPDVCQTRDQVVGCDPCGLPNPSLVVAIARAGGLGVLDLPAGDGPLAAQLLAETAERTAHSFAVRLGSWPGLVPGDDDGPLTLTGQISTVIVTAGEWLAHPGFDPRRSILRQGSTARLWVEVRSLAQARQAVALGVDGLVAKGCESGGRVEDCEAFILFQQVAPLGVPVWVCGGVGLHTAGALIAGGAAGVVLDAQLALVRESGLGSQARVAIGAMDGSETRVVGGHRLFVRPGVPAADLADDADAAGVAARLGRDINRDLVAMGQDGCMAAPLANRFVTAGGVITAVRSAIAADLASAQNATPLAEDHGVARSHGTRYPVAQGPMTRVSDRSAFALAVAEGGGLPFLALALMPGSEVRALLEETSARLGARPWGVGILGFVPPELRAEQLAVVHDVRPTVALIAGGRPAQARPLEDAGIATYLHVPSPGLLDNFLRGGARRFVFEGRECGGHVGPRSSLVLWEAQVERLMAVDDPENLHVLFAGGIHDARSAAMVATLASPLAERGAHIGVLMGTAYLFCDEAVTSGAIQPAFQAEALRCDHTILLETSPGHATRCADTPYAAAFTEAKASLTAQGAEQAAMWAELEQLNLGRLRIASKGLERVGSELVGLDAQAQRSQGMYMIGQAATLRSETTTVADLHAQVSLAATAWVDRVAAELAGGDNHRDRSGTPLDIAIVGMAACFPGAADVEQYWANVVAGANSVTTVPASRWDEAQYYDESATTVNAGRRTPSKWGGFLPEIGFDALTYGIPPSSLSSIETVQLLSLAVADRALADAGYATREFDRSRASVIFGAESGTDLAAAYGARAVIPQLTGAELSESLEEYLPALTEDSFPGVLTNVIAGRIANRLDLGGVNYTVDAACAASLAALDLACKELATNTSDVVLCGGADVHNSINDYLLFASVHALSPTGQCRTFDAAADGIALGEGVACVVLKRRADAERDGDRIYAVIEAVAGSSDGRALGLTAPRREGQRRALERAYDRAGRSPASVQLIEAHGTGTVVGDRTELRTLSELFAEHAAQPGACVLGSVKSQIGHTKCAAGLAGVIKVARALHSGVLPPTQNLDSPNPYYDEEKSPFRFLSGARPWPASDRTAGVSAFGFGGTNFHAILSAPAEQRPAHGLATWPAELFLIRGRDSETVTARLAALITLVDQVQAEDPDGQRHRLRDLAFTVSSESDGPVQVAFVATGVDELAQKLRAATRGDAEKADGIFATSGPGLSGEDGRPPGMAMLFPGQGSQRVDMLADIFVAFPRLQAHLERGEQWFDRIYPGRSFTADGRNAQQTALTDTRVAQPALGLVELAMAELLEGLGIRAEAAAGHSYGELVALCRAGVFDAATLGELSELRGEAIFAAAARADDPGAMAAVSAPAGDVAPLLAAHPGVVLANQNGPRQTVVSGPTAAIDAFLLDAGQRRLGAKRLAVSCAFHSPIVADAAAALADRLASVPVKAPSVPVWCNSTACAYPDDAQEIRELLAGQLASPVRFVDQVESMYAAGSRVFLEVGPGTVLTRLVDQILGDRPHLAVATDGGAGHGLRGLLSALAELAVHGVDVDIAPLFNERAERLTLSDLPKPGPAWTINGHLVRTKDGKPLPGGLRPADERPTPAFPLVVGGSEAAEDRRDAVVLEYLTNVRESVAAGREVMLRFLGTPASVIEPGVGSRSVAVPEPLVPATAVVESSPVPSPVTAPRDRPSGTDLLAEVLAIVSERTGYPIDMLDPGLDLEADLSIDSIKRIEIIGELVDRVGLLGTAGGGVDDEAVEELAQIKTLRGIVEWIDDRAATALSAPSSVGAEPVVSGPPVVGTEPVVSGPSSVGIEPDPSGPASDVVTPQDHAGPDASWLVPSRAVRCEVTLVDIPEPGSASGVRDRSRRRSLPPMFFANTSFVVAEDGDGVAEAFASRLRAEGASVTTVNQSTAVDDETGAVNSEVAAALHVADGVVFFAPGGAGVTGLETPRAFALFKLAASGSARWLMCVTAAGGDFGLSGDSGNGSRAGLAGLMKSLARELPKHVVRLVDVDPAGDASVVVDQLVSELLSDDGPAETGWVGTRRVTRQAVAQMGPRRDAVQLDADSVVLLTGGARGITARTALALARLGARRLVLVGRSPEPATDGSGYHDLDLDPEVTGDVRSLRGALVARGDVGTAAQIEAECRRIMAAREIRATLDGLAAIGADTTYISADVRDGAALRAVVAGVYDRFGRLDGVVHGAGVIEDRLLRDKSYESFRRVFDTKVTAARALIEAVHDDVKFVVLFASVSGVFGNRGQVDYAAANDALDAMARDAGGGRLRGRIISIDWGPWAGTGMVSPELAREYERRGVGLLAPDDAMGSLCRELAACQEGRAAPQAVVMRSWPEAMA